MPNPERTGMIVEAEFQSLIETFPKKQTDSTLSPVQQDVHADPRSTVQQAERAPYVIDHELQD